MTAQGSGDVEVTDRPEEGHFELTVDGTRAGVAAYQRDGDEVVFTHTEVDSAYRGRGLADVLAERALAQVRAAGHRAVPRCRFIAGYLRRHPAELDLVDRAHRDLVE